MGKFVDSEAKTTAVLYCPHCGNTSVQVLLLEQPFVERFYGMNTGEESAHSAVYNVVRCETCQEVLLYTYISDVYFYSDEDKFGSLVFPKQTAFTEVVPERVRQIYLEAVKVKSISQIAFVILARRVLEEISHERGVKTPNLGKALEELASRGELPPVLAEATSLVRLIGNAGAHASEAKITLPQVWAIDDFLKAIIEYLYVAPSKVAEFKKTVVSVKSPSTED